MTTNTDAESSRHRSQGTRPPPVPAKSGFWWRTLKQTGKFLFFGIVGYFLVTQARSVDWSEVVTSIRNRPPGELVLAAALAGASHALYSCFDLLGRYMTGHALPVRRVMSINFISYAFNLNMGALIGGVAFRYKLYAKYGLDTGLTTRILVVSMLTNWIGYILLAGLVFSFFPIALPEDWKMGTTGLRVLGAVLLVTVATYLLACGMARRRVWAIRGHDIVLPSGRLALLQLAMASTNWSLMALVLYVLLGKTVGFPTVLSALLLAAIAGVISHVPAGLGVLEAVFVAVLADQVPLNDLLASLLAYRGMYYLVPLAAATVLYLVVEVRTSKRATPKPTTGVALDGKGSGG